MRINGDEIGGIHLKWKNFDQRFILLSQKKISISFLYSLVKRSVALLVIINVVVIFLPLIHTTLIQYLSLCKSNQIYAKDIWHRADK